LAWKLKPTVAAWLTPSIRDAADTVHATLRARLLGEKERALFIIHHPFASLLILILPASTKY
jgi:hypothetical protein